MTIYIFEGQKGINTKLKKFIMHHPGIITVKHARFEYLMSTL